VEYFRVLEEADRRFYRAGVMQPIVNLEEQPGKIVGRRAAQVADYDRLVRNAEALMPRLPYPKGVFRFRTHEEADAWTNQHILRAALRKARAPRDATT
jgi:hypothetical protein